MIDIRWRKGIQNYYAEIPGGYSLFKLMWMLLDGSKIYLQKPSILKLPTKFWRQVVFTHIIVGTRVAWTYG